MSGVDEALDRLARQTGQAFHSDGKGPIVFIGV